MVGLNMILCRLGRCRRLWVLTKRCSWSDLTDAVHFVCICIIYMYIYIYICNIMWLKTPSCIPICGEAYWNQWLSLIFFYFWAQICLSPVCLMTMPSENKSSEIFIFFRALKEKENRYLSRSFSSLINTSLSATTLTMPWWKTFSTAYQQHWRIWIYY